MASITADDEERRGRILQHMNQSHTRELAHCLRHYAAASRSHVSRPLMRDVTLQGMQIRASGREYSVPFTSPPPSIWDDVEGRIIEMNAAARKHLGISDIYVTEYERPRWLGCVLGGGTLFCVCSALSLPWVVPGTGLWNALDAVFPGGPDWFRWMARAGIFIILAFHSIEMFVFDRNLQRHGVDRFTALWWLWMASCSIEGFGAIHRVGSIVARKRALKDGKGK